MKRSKTHLSDAKPLFTESAPHRHRWSHSENWLKKGAYIDKSKINW
jgi:hypothetical protein